jgi:Uma2 family endonuclease
MAIERGPMTADELLRLPRGRARHELVRGELRTMPLFEWPDACAIAEVSFALGNYARTHQLGDVVAAVGFQLATNPDTVRAPAVAFLRRERVEATGRVRGYWPGAPDLAVEVISPNDLYTEVEEKVAEWFEHGTQLVFVVNPRRRTVAVHRPGQPLHILAGADVLDGADVVPGWTLPVRDLFS